ncbi:MAG: M20 family metallopeptidase [Planctomycetota bacterium]
MSRRRWLASASTGALALAFAAADLRAQSAPIEAEWIEFYRDLHRHPELSFRETRTAAKFATVLQSAGFEVATNVGGLGVVGVARNGPGKTLLLRCDMDALPIGETTGLDYASTLRVEDAQGRVGGVMHACGHDVHMTAVAASAAWLSAHRDAWQGTLVVIGQPAEEVAGGAKAMLEDGLFERYPRPDMALALHVTPDLPTDTVGWREGPAMANVESVDLVVRGRGGHGAAPHLTIDPVLIASKLILDLQTIVSREIAPTNPAVVTVGSIRGGSKHNIIDSECHLQLTIRSYSQTVHEHIKTALVRKARAAAQSAGAPEPTITWSEYTPALENDPELTRLVVDAFRAELGEDHVREIAPVMTAEDFGRFRLEGIPVCMFRLGTTSPARLAAAVESGNPVAPLHSGGYFPDAEAALTTGRRALIAAVRRLLPR